MLYEVITEELTLSYPIISLIRESRGGDDYLNKLGKGASFLCLYIWPVSYIRITSYNVCYTKLLREYKMLNKKTNSYLTSPEFFLESDNFA